MNPSGIPVQNAPWFTIATGTRAPELAPDLCLDIPKDARLPHVDFNDYWNAIAYSYENTQDPFLRDRLSVMLSSAYAALGTDQLLYTLRIEARAGVIAIFESELPK